MNESQYILRLPTPLVEPMRLALSSQKRRDAAGEEKKTTSFKVHFKDERNATFIVDGKEYPASLMDLPCLVETHKTADKRTFYKSGDLHQMLVVRMPGDPAPKDHLLKQGLTPGSKKAASRLAPPEKVFSDEDVHRMEQRIKYVMDHKINLVSKKNDPQPPPPHVEEEVVIEEETAVNATPAKASNSKAARPPLPKLPEKLSEPPRPATPAEPFPTPGPSPAPDGMPSPAADTPMSFTPGPFTPTPMTPGVATPGPDGNEGDDEDDDDEFDDDEFEDMAGELVQDEEEEAKKRIERLNLTNKIEKIKADIAALEAKADKAPNPVLRNRLLSKRPPLQKELEEADGKLKELGGS